MNTAKKRDQIGSRVSSKHDRGEATIEFAVSILFILLFMLGMIEIVMLLHTYNTLADSAKEGVRYAIVHGSGNASPSGPTGATAFDPPCTSGNSSSSVTNVQNAVLGYAQLSFHSTSAMNVYVCYFDGDNYAPHRVGVVVSYPYQPFFGLSWPALTVNASAQGRISY